MASIEDMFKALRRKAHKIVTKEKTHNRKIDALVAPSISAVKDLVLSTFMLLNGSSHLTQIVDGLLNDPLYDGVIRKMLTDRYEKTFEDADIENILELTISSTGRKDVILPYFVLKHTYDDTMCMMFREISFSALAPEETTWFN